MGCDIHTCLEVKDKEGNWQSLELYKKNRYFGQYDDEPEYEKVEVYNDRNYELFSALCGVRDYTNERPKISEPKGVPDNASKETLEQYENEKDGCHSASFNNLAELYEYQTSHKIVKRSGLITPEQAEALDQGILPKGWCQGSSDKSLVWREWEAEKDVMGTLISNIEHQTREAAWVCDHKKEAENIRIVYWFDN